MYRQTAKIMFSLFTIIAGLFRIIQLNQTVNDNGGSEYLLHGNVRRGDVLPAHVLDLGVQVDVFTWNISGSVQPQCACQRTGSTAAAARDVAILA